MVPRKLTDEQQSVSLHLKSEAEENLLLLGAGVEGNYYNQKKTVFACGTTNKDEGHPFGVPGMFGIHKLCWPVDTSSSVGVVEEIQARSAWLQAAQAECLALVDSSKETFWIGADRSLLAQNATTRTTGLTALENFALSIFEYYTQTQSVGEGGEEGGDVVFDRGASGAEFWVQVKKSPPEKSESAIDVHYDKVLHIGYNIHDTHTHTPSISHSSQLKTLNPPGRIFIRSFQTGRLSLRQLRDIPIRYTGRAAHCRLGYDL
jgi:hypothetical protein